MCVETLTTITLDSGVPIGLVYNRICLLRNG